MCGNLVVEGVEFCVPESGVGRLVGYFSVSGSEISDSDSLFVRSIPAAFPCEKSLSWVGLPCCDIVTRF